MYRLWHGIQRDWKIAVIPPIICALFRAIFIGVYCPYSSFDGKWPAIGSCFTFGFQWGMGINSYILLAAFLLLTLPGCFSLRWFNAGNALRSVLVTIYSVILYIAFLGKMLFFYHYHDILNDTMLLGLNADKRNLIDIFFNQNHGMWLLAAGILFTFIVWKTASRILNTREFEWNWAGSRLFNGACAFGLVAINITGYYFFNFGCHISHRYKPESDTVPSIVKSDPFLAKAVIDDLIAVRQVLIHPPSGTLRHTDQQSLAILEKHLTPTAMNALKDGKNPLFTYQRQAKGAKIAKPSHIFIIVGESYNQSPFDQQFANLHIADGGKALRERSGAIAVDTVLSGGLISQPAISSLVTGIYDSGLELNERQTFWQCNVPTALATQLKKLGYKTAFWYGGDLSWSSLVNFLPAQGFDRLESGTIICGNNAPQTWLGVYDSLFLDKAAEMIASEKSSQPVCHLLYTTSNHVPYTMPTTDYGFNAKEIMSEAGENVLSDKALTDALGTYWYCDKAIHDFVEKMLTRFPDSLVVVTGDHTGGILNLTGMGLTPRRGSTIRERYATAFTIYHRDLTSDMLAGNDIAGHLSITPTIIELIAPAGHSYLSLFPPMTEPIDHIVTPYHWANQDYVGLYRENYYQPRKISATALPNINKPHLYQEERSALIELTAWLVRHPELLEKVR
ncbi:MAG: sulfatase-like hydrolase/transferase [Selenomonadaceae bacterium]|nr:sulfatase-like hydrolase/transferase [Selenomonadaceae bacterium]